MCPVLYYNEQPQGHWFVLVNYSLRLSYRNRGQKRDICAEMLPEGNI